MDFFILAGGYGKRTRPLSLVKPKPLFPLGGTPLIRLLISQIRDRGLNRGFVNLHYLGDKIREAVDSFPGVDIKYLQEEELSGNRILRQAVPDIEDALLVLNGDSYLEVPVDKMRRKMAESEADGVLLLRESDDNLYSAVFVEGDNYLYRKKRVAGKKLMYTGAALFKGKVLDSFTDESLFDSLARHKFNIKVLMHGGLWLDIGDPQAYFEADALYRSHIGATAGNSLSPGVEISPSAEVEHSLLWEHTTVSGSSHISHCIITGNLELKDVNYKNKIITATQVYDLP